MNTSNVFALSLLVLAASKACAAAAGGTDDILWQHRDGTVHYWPILNGQRQAGVNIGGAGPVGQEWRLIGAGDLNGDGTDDILWQHRDGTVHYWPILNGQRQAGINIGGAGPVGREWRLIGAGDLNGDGTDDILWQRRDGTVHYWPILNGQRQGGIDIGGTGPVGREWKLISAGDLNGDGTDDLLWQHNDGTVHYWPILNGQRQAGVNIGGTGPIGQEWRLIGTGDLNGDGTDDILWQHRDGTVHYWPILNGQRQGGINIGGAGPVGQEWRLIGTGDLDGDVRPSVKSARMEWVAQVAAALPPKSSTTRTQILQDGTTVGITQEPLSGVPDKMWTTGQTLRVFMSGGGAVVRSKVRGIATEWSKYANIKFQFVDSTPAEIRIGFIPGGSWSTLGRDALGVPFDFQTMNFGWLTDDSDDAEIRRVVLHEFGHALGMIHEHQSPAAGIPWDRDRVYQFFFTTQTPPWTQGDVDRNIFQEYSTSSTNYSQYDASSIMHYGYPPELTLNGIGGTRNGNLSPTDKSYAQKWYPFPTSDNGTLRLVHSCNEVDFQVEYGVEAPDTVRFIFLPGATVSWWKLVEIPIEGDKYQPLQINPDWMAPPLPSDQVLDKAKLDSSRQIRFSAAGFLGRHTLLDYRWDVVHALPGGSRVNLKWVRDRC